jgi:hypothetical protein
MTQGYRARRGGPRKINCTDGGVHHGAGVPSSPEPGCKRPEPALEGRCRRNGAGFFIGPLR